MGASTTQLREQTVDGSTALLACVLVVAVAPSGAWVVALALGPAACAAVVDARSGRLPDRLVAAALVPTAVWVGHAAIVGRGADTLPSVAFGAALLAGPLLVAHLVAPRAMGFGDVKLAGALGAAVGSVEPRLAVVALAAGAGLTAAVGLVTRRSSVAFGPGLVTGAAAAVLLSAWGDLAWR